MLLKLSVYEKRPFAKSRVSGGVCVSQGRADLVGQLQEFVDAISEQRAPSVTVADTTRAVEVLDQVLESAKSRQVISGKEGN